MERVFLSENTDTNPKIVKNKYVGVGSVKIHKVLQKNESWQHKCWKRLGKTCIR